jgi:hypothetical protein
MKPTIGRVVSRAMVLATFVLLTPFATAPAPDAATPSPEAPPSGPARPSKTSVVACPDDDADERLRCAWFDQLLALASAADAAYDAEPAWAEVRASWDGKTDALVDLILAQFVEEGVVAAPVPPSSISWVDYEPRRGRSTAGQYDRGSGAITLNHRYDWDPAYARIPYLWTLIHELLHAQGFEDESATESLTFEVVAALGNLDEPGFRGALHERLRRAALLSADCLANDGGRMIASLHGSSVCLPYETGCRELSPSTVLRDRLAEHRGTLLTPRERRRAETRLRRWDASGRYRLLDIYNARPLAIAMVAACSDDRKPGDAFPRRVDDGREEIRPQFDDLAYALDEIGIPCEEVPGGLAR